MGTCLKHCDILHVFSIMGSILDHIQNVVLDFRKTKECISFNIMFTFLKCKQIYLSINDFDFYMHPLFSVANFL